MNEFLLPDDFVSFLDAGRQLEYDPQDCEAGAVTLHRRADLRQRSFGAHCGGTSRERGISVIFGTDHFPAGPCNERGQGPDIHAGGQEMHGAIREDSVGPARVEAVDLMVVGAVDGARAWT